MIRKKFSKGKELTYRLFILLVVYFIQSSGVLQAEDFTSLLLFTRPTTSFRSVFLAISVPRSTDASVYILFHLTPPLCVTISVSFLARSLFSFYAIYFTFTLHSHFAPIARLFSLLCLFSPSCLPIVPFWIE